MILLILLCIFLLFIYCNTIEHYVTLSRKETNDLLLKNFETKDKIFKVNIVKSKEDLKECFRRGSYENCVKLYIRNKNYNRCKQCQKDSKMCYRKLYTLGGCDYCNDNLKKNNCDDPSSIACPNLHNLFSDKGVEPYYVEVIDKNNVNSPYNQSALFCWNLYNYF